MNDDRLPVAVDAMGGDFGPSVVVAGALQASRRGVSSLLVGDPAQIERHLTSAASAQEPADDASWETHIDVKPGSIEIAAASEVVPMGADPAKSVRALKDSSIVRAAEAVRDGRASALLSAGNTGAAMAASLLRMGRIKGVARPAIAVPFPVLNSTPTTVLDCGANADCQPEWLVQFAKLGTVYARERFGLAQPRVGALTIGEEAGKGNSMVKEACKLLESESWAEECGARYVGNIEGGDLMAGHADVVVCDGFSGNIVLKSLEGGFEILKNAVRDALASNEATQANLETTSSVVEPIFTIFDARDTGAAMLLGVRGVSMISHGSSSAITVANAIEVADQIAATDLVTALRTAVGSSANLER